MEAKITTAHGDEITVTGDFIKGLEGDWNQPNDPDSFLVYKVYESINGHPRETDKYYKDVLQGFIEKRMIDGEDISFYLDEEDTNIALR